VSGRIEEGPKEQGGKTQEEQHSDNNSSAESLEKTGKELGAVVSPPVQASAGASALKATVVSLARREESGLRVTIAFNNTSALPMSLVLDEESCVLSGGGQSYGPLASDLPAANGGYRIILPPGASARHALDFPTPKLGTKKLVLSLASTDGERIRTENATQSLEETP
jgi:hypothetical protein